MKTRLGFSARGKVFAQLCQGQTSVLHEQRGGFSTRTTSDTRSLSRASPASFGRLLLLTQHHQRHLPLSHKGKPDPPAPGTARRGLGEELSQEEPLAKGFYCVLLRPPKRFKHKLQGGGLCSVPGWSRRQDQPGPDTARTERIKASHGGVLPPSLV